MDKRVFIINGSGGVGKDTVCEAAAQFWHVQNVSSITPILSVARAAGWDGSKTPAARRFLSDLKAACTAFNDLPFRYCVEQWDAFQHSDAEVLFIHIREPDEIKRLRRVIGDCCKTIWCAALRWKRVGGLWAIVRTTRWPVILTTAFW